MPKKAFNIRWRDGIDRVVIDINITRYMTDKEIENRESEANKGLGINPFIGNFKWLDCFFIPEFAHLKDKCIKIIKHLGGYD